MTDDEVSSAARFDRRAFVARAGLVAAGAVGVSLLGACAPAAAPSAPAAGGAPASGAAGATPAAASGGAVKLPTYLPFQGPKPDLAGNEQGLDPAFFKFPTDLTQTVSS